ncbi:hypothetical protein AMELA_G00050140 [Ameiurus melas]|uniref:Uncharacterized protein n=1 Tax=Ameiurus melas TaxID=219545 RepID=A0A7J6B595_AMEME|nr:hypothetical protein AMELA_G00050140 [Ameiurus melas]
MSLLGQSCCQSRTGTSRCAHRCMNVACGRGRYDTQSMTERDSNAFIKFQPKASPPSPRAPLAPLRDDVPLTEPHSGLLSLSDMDTFPHIVCRAAPWGQRAARHQAHSPAFGPAAGRRHTSADKRRDSRLELTERKYHSSRERPDQGSTSPLGCEDLKRVGVKDTCTSVPPKLMDKALRYIYTSEAQRGYEDIDQDSKLKPPLRILEKMADPVSQCFTLKRYHSRPELWQTIGPHWNRHQIRIFLL